MSAKFKKVRIISKKFSEDGIGLEKLPKLFEYEEGEEDEKGEEDEVLTLEEMADLTKLHEEAVAPTQEEED